VNPPVSTTQFLRWATVFYLALALVAWIWRTLIMGGSLLTSDSPEMGPMSALGVGTVAGLALVVASRWFTMRSRAGAALADALREALPPLRRKDAWLLALLSGFGEEALFRGALQPEVGLFWASLLFALVHLVPRRPLLIWSALAGLAGVAFGLLYHWTGQLWAPVAAHVVVNGLNLHWLDQTRRQRGSSVQRGDGVDLDSGTEG